MPWLLQPKNYTQIARPNLYNVAYRRVGGYKGMGRLHPTNYLEIGPRSNRIGGTTGQYNTLSGQLMLLPPSLRGLGQTVQLPASRADLQWHCDPITDPLCGLGPDWQAQLYPPTGPAGGPQTPLELLQAVQTQGELFPSSLPTGQEAAAAIAQQRMQRWLPWIVGGALVLMLVAGRR